MAADEKVAAPREYESPRIEAVLTAEELAREVLYAGAIPSGDI
jgi:hypothetical protein